MSKKNILFDSDINNDRHFDLSEQYVDRNNHLKAAYVFKFTKNNKNSDEITNIVFKDTHFSNKQFLDKYFYENPYSRSNNQNNPDWYIFSEYMSSDKSNPLSSININKYLRNYEGWKNDIEERIFRLNSYIDKFVLKEDLVVYRGFTINSNNHLSQELDQAYKYLHENGEPYGFVDMGFLSTTKDPVYARFLADNGNGDVTVYMALIAKKGCKCIPICSEYSTSMNDNEKEIIFPSFHKYKIIGIERYRFLKRLHYNLIVLAEEQL